MKETLNGNRQKTHIYPFIILSNDRFHSARKHESGLTHVYRYFLPAFVKHGIAYFTYIFPVLTYLSENNLEEPTNTLKWVSLKSQVVCVSQKFQLNAATNAEQKFRDHFDQTTKFS